VVGLVVVVVLVVADGVVVFPTGGRVCDGSIGVAFEVLILLNVGLVAVGVVGLESALLVGEVATTETLVGEPTVGLEEGTLVKVFGSTGLAEVTVTSFKGVRAGLEVVAGVGVEVGVEEVDGGAEVGVEVVVLVGPLVLVTVVGIDLIGAGVEVEVEVEVGVGVLFGVLLLPVLLELSVETF